MTPEFLAGLIDLDEGFFTAQGKGKVAGKDVVTTAYSPAVSFEVKAPVKPADAKPAAK